MTVGQISHSSVDLLARLRSGDTRALARAISLVEDNTAAAAELLAACHAAESLTSRPALRIGVTGPPGAGKSTLVDRLVRAFRAQSKTVAVLAIDPSSPYTGGALLGDRIRISGFAGDEGVYLRSMASRGASGGLASAASDACAVLAAAGRGVILIETVGVGQSEVEIAGIADLTLLVLVPGMGDDVQTLKAGILEIADIFVVNKADLDGVDRIEAELLAMQSLTPSHTQGATLPFPPIIRTVATTGQGIDQLVAAMTSRIERMPRSFPPIVGISKHVGFNSSAHTAKTIRPLAAEVPHHLDHLGIAVRSIAAAREFYALLGLTVTKEETIEHEQVRTAMLPLGDTRLELLEPTVSDSTIGRFLVKRGEGLHHVAMRLDGTASNIDDLFTHLRAQGIRLASDCIRSGAGGHRYFFIHPESTGGVLLEIVASPHSPIPPTAVPEAVAE